MAHFHQGWSELQSINICDCLGVIRPGNEYLSYMFTLMTKARCLWVLMGFFAKSESGTTPWFHWACLCNHTCVMLLCSKWLMSITTAWYHRAAPIMFILSFLLNSVPFIFENPAYDLSCSHVWPSLCSSAFTYECKESVTCHSHLHGHFNQHEQLFNADPQILALHSFCYAGSLNVLKTPQQL